jgi:hypothetical protein
LNFIDKEQLKILLQWVEAWNCWRYENPSEKIDLHGLALPYAKLAKIDYEIKQLPYIHEIK